MPKAEDDVLVEGPPGKVGELSHQGAQEDDRHLALHPALGARPGAAEKLVDAPHPVKAQENPGELLHRLQVEARDEGVVPGHQESHQAEQGVQERRSQLPAPQLSQEEGHPPARDSEAELRVCQGQGVEEVQGRVGLPGGGLVAQAVLHHEVEDWLLFARHGAAAEEDVRLENAQSLVVLPPGPQNRKEGLQGPGLARQRLVASVQHDGAPELEPLLQEVHRVIRAEVEGAVIDEREDDLAQG